MSAENSADDAHGAMKTFEDTFEWVDMPDGRARFSGIQRGWDECGRVTFCVELAGTELYGEIDQAFLDNGNDFDLEVVSFGGGGGRRMSACRACRSPSRRTR